MTDAANLDIVAVGADEEEAVVTNTQPKVPLCLAELSRRPCRILQSGAAPRECA
jgi:hypothetical protein